jgi:hypothetical protein
LVFPVASSEQIAVDLEGYYAPPGAALDPSTTTTTSAGSLKAATTGIQSLKPAPQLHGSTGDLDLDVTDTFFNVTGFIGSAQAARPWVLLKTGASGGSGGFAVYGKLPQRADRLWGSVVGCPAQRRAQRSDHESDPGRYLLVDEPGDLLQCRQHR